MGKIYDMAATFDPDARKRHLRDKLESLRVIAQDIADEIARFECKLAELEPQPVDPQLPLPGVK